MQNNDHRSEELVEQSNQEQEPIEVATRYIWEAIYDNGQDRLVEVERVEGQIEKRWFRDIDLPRTTFFILHDLVQAGKSVAVQLDHEAGQRLIFFRRHSTEYNMQTGGAEKHEPVHVVGYQKTIHGTNVSVYVYLFPDGSILLSDKHDAV